MSPVPATGYRALMRTPAYVWAAILLAGMLALMLRLTHQSPLTGAVEVQQAQLVSSPPEVPHAEVVALPHVWDDAHHRWQGRAIYRLSVPASLLSANSAAQDMGLLIPRAGVRFRVRLNGHELLDRMGRSADGYMDTGTHAHFVRLPVGLLNRYALGNEVEIELSGASLRISGLGPVWFGPAAALEQRYQWLHWWQVELTWMLAAGGLLLGLLSLLIWGRTGDRLFGLVAGCLLVLALRLWLSTPIDLSGPFWAWDYLHKLSFTFYCGFIYLFISELFVFRQALTRKVVITMMLIGPLWLALLVWSEDYQLYRIWNGVIVLICVVALLQVIHRARWGLDRDQRLMVVVGLATVLFGVRDYLAVQLHVAGDADIRWMTPGAVFMMFSMVWLLLQRTTQSLEQAGRLNMELGRRVDEREKEVQALFDRLRLVESQRVLEAERRRLTRDMHDGLGSQLVQALNTVRGSGEHLDSRVLADMLNHALEDLRMTLDSLEPMDGDLPTILGTLRQRIAPALQAAGVELVWQVQEVPPVPGLEARGVLHLFRCLQEVFANVLKHAQASRVTVSTRDLGHGVELSVCDNGRGLGPDGAAARREGGRGMRNIRMRAAELGVEVEFADAGPGTCVRFLFPVPPAQTPLCFPVKA